MKKDGKKGDLAGRIMRQILILIMVVSATAMITRNIVLRDSPEYNPITKVEAEEYSEPIVSDSIREETPPREETHPRKEVPVIFEDEEKQAELEAQAEEYPALKEFLLDFPMDGPKVLGGITQEELETEYPLFIQFDRRWGYSAYGDSILALCGCAPTALSMVVVGLTGDEKATPNAIADYCMEKNLYVVNSGTSWTLFTDYAQHFGVSGQYMPVSKQGMINALDAGHRIILSVGPGDFTDNGHFIVIVGYKNGKFVVRDPGSEERSHMLWSFERLMPQIKNMWEFERIN